MVVQRLKEAVSCAANVLTENMTLRGSDWIHDESEDGRVVDDSIKFFV